MSQVSPQELTRLVGTLRRRRRRAVEPRGEQRAAVLVPLYEQHDGVGVVLTRRTQSLARHAGEVSFPGGLPDVPGEDPVETALREAREEVGLEPSDAQILGLLDDGSTTTGFVITPVVGRIPHPYPFRRSREEVAEILALPLSLFRAPGVLRTEVMQRNGRSFVVPFFELEAATVWGATARILDHLLDVLADAGGIECGQSSINPANT